MGSFGRPAYDAAAPALTEALIAARFLTTDRGSDEGGQPDEAGAGRNDGPAGIPVASLAHEALLTHWEKVAHWVERNRIKLRLRGRVEQSRQRWEQSEPRCQPAAGQRFSAG